MVPDYLIDLFTKISTLHNHETRQINLTWHSPGQIPTFVKNHSRTVQQSFSYSTAPLYCTRMIFYKSWYLA